MTGIAAVDAMDFDWGDTWRVTDSFPELVAFSDGSEPAAVIIDAQQLTNPSAADAGATVSVSVPINNAGGTEGSDEITLSKSDGTQLDAQTVTVAVNTPQTITLNWSSAPTDFGSHTLTVASAAQTRTVAVTLNRVNIPPVATNTTVALTQDATATGNITDDVNDADNDTLLVNTTPVRGPLSDATLNITSSGAWSYTPPAGYTGDDSFAYNVSDQNGSFTIGEVAFTITAPDSGGPPDDDSGESEGSGSGAGSSSGGSSGGSSSGPSISVSPAATTGDVSGGAGSGGAGGEGTSVDVSLDNVNSVEPVSIDLGDASGSSGETTASESGLRNVLADGLDVTIRRSGDYDLRVTSRDIDVVAASADTGSDTPDLSTDAFDDEGERFFEATTQRPVGFITVDHDFEASDVETATHKFRVRKSYLDATGASVESVRLYRDTGETYQELPTRLVDEDDEYHYFEADTPGFSTFVIGTAAPVFTFEDATLDAADEATGAVEAAVSVTNVGQEDGTAAVVLAADDATLGTVEATVQAGETVVVSVDGVVEATTPVTLSIANQPLGPFTRESLTDGEPTEESESADGDGGSDAVDQVAAEPGSGSMLVIVFVAAIVGGLFFFLLWRQKGRDKEREQRRKRGKPQ